jgi:hypothetical protein
VNNETSSLFVTSTGLGETLGPVISSVVNHYHGFTAAQDFFASFSMCFCLMYFFLGGGIYIFAYTEKEIQNSGSMAFYSPKRDSKTELTHYKM